MPAGYRLIDRIRRSVGPELEGAEQQPAPALSTTKTFFSRTGSSSRRSCCRHPIWLPEAIYMLASGNFMVDMYLFVRSCGHHRAVLRRCERRRQDLRPTAALVRDRPSPAPPLVKPSWRRRRVRFERGVAGRRSPSAARQPRSSTARSGEATMCRTSLAVLHRTRTTGVDPGEVRRRRRGARSVPRGRGRVRPSTAWPATRPEPGAT